LCPRRRGCKSLRSPCSFTRSPPRLHAT
jgi:hypothetical protein